MVNTSEKIPFEQSMSSLLLAIEKKYPVNAALSVEGVIYSYQELFQKAKVLATELLKYPNERCIILSGRNIVAYVGLLGALLAGKAYVFLNNKDSLERIQTSFSKIDSQLMVVDAEHVSLANKIAPNAVIMDPQNLDDAISYRQPDTAYLFAYLMFTSGSSGNPKGVAISHQNLLAYVKNISKRTRPNPEDRVSQISELSFDFSVHDIFLAWSSGACLCVLPDHGILGLPKFILRNKITFVAAVPSTIHLLHQLNREEDTFLSVRYTGFCGEILSNEIAKLWNTYAPNSVIDNLYGPTEATVAITAFRWFPEYSEDRVSIGSVFLDQEILLLNEDGALASQGEMGEIYLLGSQVATEYWRSKKLSKEKFFPVFSVKEKKNIFAYRTGDLAYYDAKHQLCYKGRCDDQLKLRGYRVEKIEIESAIQKIASTQMAAVVSNNCEKSGNVDYLTCFIAKSPFHSDEISRRCRSELPDYMIPNRIITLLDFPYNKNGKVDYQELKSLSRKKGA